MSIPLEHNGEDPIALLSRWIADATASEPNDPTAAALATATRDGHPSVRMVLLKGWDQNGLSFYTNAGSRKGRELESNPVASLCLHWKTLRRQVRVEGTVSQLPLDVADHYFHSRSRGSQIAAAVSRQSQPLESRQRLVEEVAALSQSIEGQEVPRPPAWRGYLVKPSVMEFWSDGKDRLHDRVQFTLGPDGWRSQRLYP